MRMASPCSSYRSQGGFHRSSAHLQRGRLQVVAPVSPCQLATAAAPPAKALGPAWLAHARQVPQRQRAVRPDAAARARGASPTAAAAGGHAATDAVRKDGAARSLLQRRRLWR